MCSEHVSLSDEGPLLETSEFFEISHSSYQPLNFLPCLSLSTQYCILISLITFSYFGFINKDISRDRTFLPQSEAKSKANY